MVIASMTCDAGEAMSGQRRQAPRRSSASAHGRFAVTAPPRHGVLAAREFDAANRRLERRVCAAELTPDAAQRSNLSAERR